MNIKNLSKILLVVAILANYLYSSDKKIVIFDPLNYHGTNLCSTIKSFFPDSVCIIFKINSTIYDSDALFLFLSNDSNEYILDGEEGESLINYMVNGKYVYVYSEIISQNIANVSFWNYIGIQYWAGFHYYDFDLSSLSSGLYYYKLQSDSKSQVKKLIIMN